MSEVDEPGFPLGSTEPAIGRAGGPDAYHGEGGPSGRLSDEAADAREAGRRDGRERVSPGPAPERPTEKPSGKHTPE